MLQLLCCCRCFTSISRLPFSPFEHSNRKKYILTTFVVVRHYLLNKVATEWFGNVVYLRVVMCFLLFFFVYVYCMQQQNSICSHQAGNPRPNHFISFQFCYFINKTNGEKWLVYVYQLKSACICFEFFYFIFTLLFSPKSRLESTLSNLKNS